MLTISQNRHKVKSSTNFIYIAGYSSYKHCAKRSTVTVKKNCVEQSLISSKSKSNTIEMTRKIYIGFSTCCLPVKSSIIS